MKSRTAWRAAQGSARLSSGGVRLLVDAIVIAGPVAAWLTAGVIGALLVGLPWWGGVALAIGVLSVTGAHDGDRLSAHRLSESIRTGVEDARGRARARMIRREWPRVCERAGWIGARDLEARRPVPALRFVRRMGRRLVVAWRPVESTPPQDYGRHVEALRRTLGAHAVDWRPVTADPGTLVAMFGMDPLPDHVAPPDAVVGQTKAPQHGPESLAVHQHDQESSELGERNEQATAGCRVDAGGDSPPSSWAVPERVFILGPDSGGGQVIWNPHDAPHLLVCGTTGSGKGSVLRTLVRQAMGAGWDVDVIDGKQGGEYRWAGDAGAEVSAQGVALAVDRLGDLEMEVNDVVRLLWQHGVECWRELSEHTEVLRRLVVVDEAAELMMLRRLPDEKEADQHRAAFASRLARIVSQGRAVGMHVIVALQRPDTALLGPSGGFLRSNLTGRIAVGSLDGDGAEMMFGPGGRDAVAAYLDGTPGRALAVGLTRGQVAPSPFQVHYLRSVEMREGPRDVAS